MINKIPNRDPSVGLAAEIGGFETAKAASGIGSDLLKLTQSVSGMGGWGEVSRFMQRECAKAGARDEQETDHTAPAKGTLQILRLQVKAPATLRNIGETHSTRN
jgi:hypothetical protein